MHLSEKRKGFSLFFVPYMESTSNVEHFQKKEIVIANVLTKLQSLKDLVRPLSKKRRSTTSFNGQHVISSQIL